MGKTDGEPFSVKDIHLILSSNKWILIYCTVDFAHHFLPFDLPSTDWSAVLFHHLLTIKHDVLTIRDDVAVEMKSLSTNPQEMGEVHLYCLVYAEHPRNAHSNRRKASTAQTPHPKCRSVQLFTAQPVRPYLSILRDKRCARVCEFACGSRPLVAWRGCRSIQSRTAKKGCGGMPVSSSILPLEN